MSGPQHNLDQYDENFGKILTEKIEELIKANVVQNKLEKEIRLLAGCVRFVFMKGGVVVVLHKITMQLDENILAQMKKIWGEKTPPGRGWDILNFGEN